MADPLETALHEATVLEESFYQTGWEQGAKAGEEQGYREGLNFGYVAGASGALGSEGLLFWYARHFVNPTPPPGFPLSLTSPRRIKKGVDMGLEVGYYHGCLAELARVCGSDPSSR